ncbi:MAG: HU family DNA-binding protein [Alphaproteobacteria bacterium]
MNKNELEPEVAKSARHSKAEAGRAVEAEIETVTGPIAKGDEERLVGFGTFNTQKRAATTGRNPRTQEPMKIPASIQPRFKAGKVLKESVQVLLKK